MQTDEPRPSGEPTDEDRPADDLERDRSLGSAWRLAGLAFGDLGTDVGDSLRRAWAEAGEQTPEETADGLRRLADLFGRSVQTARSAATSEAARARVNSSARRAGGRLEHAVRLSLAELGRALERVEPRRREPKRGEPKGGRATTEDRDPALD